MSLVVCASCGLHAEAVLLAAASEDDWEVPVNMVAFDRYDRSVDRSVRSIRYPTDDDETTTTTTTRRRNSDDDDEHSADIFLNFRSGRCDRFGPKIVKIRAILVIFRTFEIFRGRTFAKL